MLPYPMLSANRLSREICKTQSVNIIIIIIIMLIYFRCKVRRENMYKTHKQT